jgi:hypothetical protein
MKHAGPDTLDELDDLLAEVRQHPELRERKRGAFYRGSSGFLHFHEDQAGIFADLKINNQFERFRVTTPAERRSLIGRIRALLSSSGNARSRS